MKTALDLKALNISSELLREIPARVAVHYAVIPLSLEAGVLQVGIPCGMSRALREELKILLGRQLELVPLLKTEIETLIAKFYGMGAGVIESLTQDQGLEIEKNDFEVIDQDKKEDATMTRLVNELFMDAIQARASDIHIEPFDRILRIRYRVDGLLQEARVSDQIRSLAAHLVSRIKIMARLDIGEKRLPQDGRIKVKQKNEELDLRVSVLPSSFGEAVVVRILKPLALLEMADLGFDPKALVGIQKLLQKPNGVILITGPTGSGKTTTLYSCLRELNQTERKIITVEDPVEYKLPGVIQLQVHPKIEFTFAKALRAILRHDPDCLMIGEIRDSETAEIAMSSALTGHLVFSTLHTNDAPSAVTRLMEMGIEPYLVASVLEAVIAQRLVRRLCSLCAEKANPDCGKCSGSGFYGRIAIYEIMVMNDSIREQIGKKGVASILRELARENGMHSLFEDGMLKVKAGFTSEDEIRRVIC